MEKLLVILLVYICPITFIFGEKNNYTNDFNWIPDVYFIEIKVDPLVKIPSFCGNVSIDGKTTKANAQLHLHSRVNITEASIMINGKSKKIDFYKEEYNGPNDIITLNTTDRLRANQYFTLHLKFCSVLSEGEGPIYFIREIEGNKLKRPLIGTEFYSHGARSLFPCIDLPRFKANFQLKLSSESDIHTTLANMPLEKNLDEDYNATMLFYQSSPMITTSVAFIMFNSDFECKVLPDSNTICHYSKTQKNIEYLEEIISNMQLKIEKFLYLSHSLPKIAHILIGEDRTDLTESRSLIKWRNDYLKERNIMTIDKELLFRERVANKIAKQWFGNLVTPRYWCYRWVNDILANYVAKIITAQSYTNSKALEFFIANKFSRSMEKEISYPSKRDETHCHENDTTVLPYEYDNYEKGAAILHMFVSSVMSGKEFRKALKTYINNNMYFPVTPAELWKAMEMNLNRAYRNKINKYINLDVLMKSWTDNKGYPILSVHRYNTFILIHQKRIIDNHDDSQYTYWWIPITYTTSKEKDFTNTKIKQWMMPMGDYQIINSIYHISANEWIIFNIRNTGFYRVQYDLQTYKLLTQHLMEKDINDIHPLNRAQLISDAYELVKANYIEIDILLNLLKYLEKETHFLPFCAGVDAILNIMKYKSVEIQRKLNNFLGKIINQAYKTIVSTNFNYSHVMNYMYKMKVVQTICFLNFKDCTLHANQLSQAIVANYKNELSVIPDLQVTMWCNIVKNDNLKAIDFLLKRIGDWHTPQSLMEIYLESLSCSSKAEILSIVIRSIWFKKRVYQHEETLLIENIAPKDYDCVLTNFLHDNIDWLINNHGRDKIILFIKRLSPRIRTSKCFDQLLFLSDSRNIALPSLQSIFNSSLERNITKWIDEQSKQYFLYKPFEFGCSENLNNNMFYKHTDHNFFNNTLL
ncbi:aminopeptidase Ey-like [Cimex lectularius]|uniref:Aminopeptidase n=1 Tax=Cimex lectularius TaxID=79782 RepID=A0A8I6TJA4_CIMLE|nr:aminopeptidase Ey-like [Cimex lectularius]